MKTIILSIALILNSWAFNIFRNIYLGLTLGLLLVSVIFSLINDVRRFSEWKKSLKRAKAISKSKN